MNRPNMQAPGGAGNPGGGAGGSPPATGAGAGAGAAGTANAGGQQPLQGLMYKPEQMRNIKELTAVEKQKFEAGLRNLWKLFNEAPEGSPEKENAGRKILEFTPVLTRKIRERRQLSSQQQQQQQAAQTARFLAGSGNGVGAGAGAGGPADRPVPTPAGPQQGGMEQQAQQPHQQMAQPGNQPTVATPATGQPQPLQQTQTQQPIKFSAQVISTLNQQTYYPLPSMANKTPEEIAKWQEDVKMKLGVSLSQIEVFRNQIHKIDANLKMRTENGTITPEDQKALKEQRDALQKRMDIAVRFITSFRKQQEAAKAQLQLMQQQQQQQQQQQAAGRAGENSTVNSQTRQPNQQLPPQANAAAAAAAAQQEQQQQEQQAGTTNLQNSQANINNAFEAAKKESIAAAARQGSANGPASATNTIGTNNKAKGPAGGKLSLGPVQQTPIPPPVIPAAALQQTQKQQQQKQTPVHPPPTPINTAAAAAMRSTGLASAGTPTLAPAQSNAQAAAQQASAARAAAQQQMAAHPVNAQPPALSHQRALEEANRQKMVEQRAENESAAAASGTGAGGAQQQQQQPPLAPAGGVVAGGVLPGTQRQHLQQQTMQQQQQMTTHQLQLQQQQAHAQAQAQAQKQQQQPGRGQQSGGSTPVGAGNSASAAGPSQYVPDKHPIPKQLSERATQVPQPVSLGGGVAPGRPTLTGGSGIVGGVMGQPAVAKVPAIQIEGEGERVLNKKKLDELVRQVCGGTTEDHEGNLLQPEVEESILNLADSFVDSVLHSACRNAKERGSKVLEIRDIQLVLERTYNIRIPGYSSDELRIVRKVQPSMAWITKMSVIQAAKVTAVNKNDS